MENRYRLRLAPPAPARDASFLEEQESCAVHYQLLCERVNENGQAPRIWTWRMELPRDVVQRALWHQRRPEEIPSSPADAEVVRSATPSRTATPRDLGAWLGETVLPADLRQELAKHCVKDGAFVLELDLPPELAVLPWEALGFRMRPEPPAEPVHPVLGEYGQLIRWIPREDPVPRKVPAPPTPSWLRPRVLLIGGAMQQADRSARHDVLAVYRAIREAGFSCELAHGAHSISNIDGVGEPVTHVLQSADQLVDLIARQVDPFTIVHFIGHSDAAERDRKDLCGARALLLDIQRGEEPRLERLELVDEQGAPRPFVEALVGKCELFVVQACNSREEIARPLLASGAASAVIGLGAMAEPELCAVTAAAFYPTLFGTREISEGVRAMRRALLAHEEMAARAWMPLIFANAHPLPRLAEDSEELLELYCTRVSAEHRSHRGRFCNLYLMPETGYVKLNVAPDRAPGTEQKNDLHRSVLGPPAGQALPFAEMLRWQEGEHGRRAWTLTGPPGAGKTTTLRTHVLELARDKRRERIPIYIDLATWLRAAKRDETLLDVVRYASRRDNQSRALQQKLEDALRRKLAEGRVFLALDGYDELDSRLRRLLKQAAPWRGDKLANSILVLGTRPRLNTSELPAALGDLVLQELELDRAAELLRCMLRAGGLDASDADACVAYRKRTWVDGRHFWRDLMSRPYAVAWLALIELDDEEEQIIESRSAFLDRVLLELARGGGLWREEPEISPGRATRGIADPDGALRLLGHLALCFVRSFAASLPKSELRKFLEDAEAQAELTARGQSADEFLKELAEQTVLFGPDSTRSSSQWRFLHRSLLEALAARELERRFFTGEDADELGPERLFSQLAKWKELKGFEMVDAKALAERTTLLMELSQSEAGIQELYFRALNLRDDRRELRRNELYPLGKRGDRDAIRKIVVPELARFELRAERAEFWIEPLVFLAQRRSRREVLFRALCEKLPELRRPCIERLDCIALAEWRLATSARVFHELEDRCDAIEIASEKLPESDRLAACAELTKRIEDAEILSERGALAEALLALAPGFPVAKLLDHRHPGPKTRALRDVLPNFVRVPGGSYWIGTTAGGPSVREERCRVELAPDLWIADVPVTVKLYRLFAPHEEMNWKGASRSLLELPPDLPVVSVSWYAARLFCHWLTRHASELLSDVAGHGRPLAAILPDEALWEVAARAGSAEELDYWTGNGAAALAEIGWYAANSHDELHPVRQKRANPWGLYDTSGNAWEWCATPYLPSTQAALRESGRGRMRVLRGGSFGYDAPVCRSANRYASRPSVCNPGIGFRVALAPAPGLGGP